MKKNWLKVGACALALTMVFSLGACSSDDKKSETKKTEETKTDDGKFTSIEAYLNDATVKSQMKQVMDSLEGSGMKVEIKADGDKLVYSYQYEEIENMDGLKEQLATQLDAQAATFENTASSLKTAVDVENPVVVVEYIDAKGEMIHSAEFAAK